MWLSLRRGECEGRVFAGGEGRVLLFSRLNSSYTTGTKSPIDPSFMIYQIVSENCGLVVCGEIATPVPEGQLMPSVQKEDFYFEELL